MLWRVEVGLRPHLMDALGQRVRNKISRELDIDVDDVSTIKVYTITGLDRSQMQRVLENHVLDDPILHRASLNPLPGEFDWTLEVGFRPGVTDNEGRTATASLAMVLGLAARPLPGDPALDMAVYTSTRYMLRGRLGEEEVRRIATGLLA